MAGRPSPSLKDGERPWLASPTTGTPIEPPYNTDLFRTFSYTILYLYQLNVVCRYLQRALS
jgi:hypothetical protein